MSSVSVVTPSLPSRHNFLVECMASVRAQTLQPEIHLIGIDNEHIGGAAMLNKLISAASTEWIAPLADDDLLLPHHLDTLIANSAGADMVYPFCEVEGKPGWNPNSFFDPARLRVGNYIPATVLIRREAILELGGYPNAVCEDHAMWVRMLDAGMTIRCVPEVTWIYRIHNFPDGSPGNISHGWHVSDKWAENVNR